MALPITAHDVNRLHLRKGQAGFSFICVPKVLSASRANWPAISVGLDQNTRPPNGRAMINTPWPFRCPLAGLSSRDAPVLATMPLMRPESPVKWHKRQSATIPRRRYFAVQRR